MIAKKKVFYQLTKFIGKRCHGPKYLACKKEGQWQFSIVEVPVLKHEGESKK